MVLVLHDVYHKDWIRLCQVIFCAPFSLAPFLIFFSMQDLALL